MTVNSSALKRSAALMFMLVLVAGPVLVFLGPANAASHSYQTSRKNAGTPNSSQVTRDSHGQVISYGNNSITYNAP